MFFYCLKISQLFGRCFLPLHTPGLNQSLLVTWDSVCLTGGHILCNKWFSQQPQIYMYGLTALNQSHMDLYGYFFILFMMCWCLSCIMLLLGSHTVLPIYSTDFRFFFLICDVWNWKAFEKQMKYDSCFFTCHMKEQCQLKPLIFNIYSICTWNLKYLFLPLLQHLLVHPNFPKGFNGCGFCFTF